MTYQNISTHQIVWCLIKSDSLYGEHAAASAAYRNNQSIIVEGYLDVIALHKAGFTHAMACLGTSITESHIQELWRYGKEIIVCLDGDHAGLNATIKLIHKVLDKVIAGQKIISFVNLPQGRDPDDVIKSQGVSVFKKIIRHRVSLYEMIWYIEYENKKNLIDFSNADQKAILRTKLLNYCNKITDLSIQKEYKQYFIDQIYQLLGRGNTKWQKKQVSVNYNLMHMTPKYSKMEILETSIAVYMMKFPSIFSSENFVQFLENFNFQTEIFYLFRDWYIDIMVNKEQVTSNFLEENIKNTSFYNDFLVVFKIRNDAHIDFTLDYASKNDNKLKVLKWLYLEHYRELLVKEYNKIELNKEVQFFSYKEEIHKSNKLAVNIKNELMGITNDCTGDVTTKPDNSIHNLTFNNN